MFFYIYLVYILGNKLPEKLCLPKIFNQSFLQKTWHIEVVNFTKLKVFLINKNYIIVSFNNVLLNIMYYSFICKKKLYKYFTFNNIFKIQYKIYHNVKK